MASVERLLAPGERVVFRTRLHPQVLVGALSTAAFVGLVTTLLIVNNDLSLGTDIQIVAVGLAVMALFLVRPVLRWRRTAFLVTDRRLLVRSGALRESILEVPFGRGSGIAVEQGGRRAHGTIAVSLPDGRSWRFGHVASAEQLADAARAEGRRAGR